MKRRTLFAAVPILAVIVLAALWAASPAILSRAAATLLARGGLTDVALTVSRPGASRLQAAGLSAATADGLRIELADITIDYSLSGLVHGRVDTVRVAEARIDLPARSAGSVPLTLPATLPALDPGAWLDVIPSGGIEVARLAIVPAGGAAPAPFAVRLTGNTRSALLSARPLADKASDRLLEVVADRGGRVNAVLAFEDPAQAPALELNLLPARGPASGYDVTLETSAGALAAWAAPMVPRSLDAAGCALVATLKLTENPLDALDVDARVTDCRVGDWTLERGALKAIFMKTAHGLASVTPARLALARWSMPGIDGDGMTVRAGVDIDLEAQRATVPAGAAMSVGAVTAHGVTVVPFEANLEETLALSLDAPAGRAVLGVPTAAARIEGFALATGASRIDIDFGSGEGPALDAALADVVVDGSGYRARLPTATMALADDVAHVAFPEAALEWQGATAVASNGRVDLPLSGTDASTLAATASALAVDAEGYGAHFDDAVAALDWRRAAINGTLAASLAGMMPVAGSFTLDPAADAGAVTLRAPPIPLGERPRRASELVQGWPAGVDLVSGALGFDIDVRWDAGGASAWCVVDLVDAGGVVEEVYFSDASTRLEIGLYPEVRSLSPAAVTVATVDYGVALSGVTATAEIDGLVDGAPRIVATDINAGLFGGSAFVPRFDSASGEPFDIVLDGIDLAVVVGRDRFPGLAMEGRVAGRVPVEFGDDGLYINGGQIENTGDGVLHYDPGDAGAGSGVEILFRSLKNFEYHALRVKPEYHPDGTLILDVHLEGTSEEIGRNQPIHFNINIEQNLLRLLESIRLVSGLNDRIDRGVQDYYDRRSQ